MTKWLMQSSGFSSKNIEKSFNAMKRLNLKFDDFGLIPFTNRVTNLENCLEEDLNTVYVIKGGTKLLKVLNEVNTLKEMDENIYENLNKNSNIYIESLKAGIDYSFKNFDLNYYKELNLPLLNQDARYMPYEEVKNEKFKTKKFIKPSRDLKAFNGGIMGEDITIEEFIKNNQCQDFFKEETIVINDLKTIYAEYRFFIIGEDIITYSQYMRGNRLILDSNVPDFIIDSAKEYAKLYKPAEIFVMDLADTDQGIKIIEYNCWNASGLYECNVMKLFNEVNEYKKEQYAKNK